MPCTEDGHHDGCQHRRLAGVEQGTDRAADSAFGERPERLGADVLDRQAEDDRRDKKFGFAQDNRGAEDGDLG